MTLWLGDNLRNQASSLYQQGKYAEALGKIDEALNIYEVSFGPHYDQYPTALTVKGLSLAKTGRLREGEQILREAVMIRSRSLPPDHFWVSLANSALGECLMMQGLNKQAEPLLTESYENLRRSQGEQNPRTLLVKRRLDAINEMRHKTDIVAQNIHNH